MAHQRRPLEPTMVCVKNLLMGLNCLFVMTGMLLVSIGSAIKGLYSGYDEFFGSNLGSPAAFLMAVGVIVFFVALFGCIGSMRESTCLINMYTISLIVIFIFEAAAAISGFAMQTTIRATLGDNMKWNIQHNYLNPEHNMSADIDNIQQGLECCGAYGVEDWEGVFPNETKVASPYYEYLSEDDIIVPDSCCGELDGTECVTPFTKGCLPQLTDSVQAGIMLITGVAITMAAIQAMCIYFANELTKAIRRAKSVRAMRQMEIRNNIASAMSYEPMDKQQVPTTPTPVIYLAASTDYTVA